MFNSKVQRLICACMVAGAGYTSAGSSAFKSSQSLPKPLEGLIEKNFSADWESSLYAKGERRWRSGDELKWIGMPVGGIYAGQVYLGGDGKLWHWDVFNENIYTWGGHYTNPLNPDAPRTRWLSSKPLKKVNQGFALKWKSGSKKGIQSLDKDGFEEIEFCGEYPMGFVKYQDEAVPVDVELTAFSPFVPLSADDSSYPATVMQYTVSNNSHKVVDVEIGGWLGNHALLDTGAPEGLMRRNNSIKSGSDLTTLLCRVEPVAEEHSERADLALDRLNSDGYAGWTITGEAFGTEPAPKWQVRDFMYFDVNCPYDKLIHTYWTSPGAAREDKNQSTGRLVREAFKVERDYIGFWIGGGDAAGKTCVNLLVDGQVVDSATGRRDSMMRPFFFDMHTFAGKQAQLEVVVDNCGDDFNWISATGFIQTDNRATHLQARSRDYGTMALSLLGGEQVTSFANISGQDLVAEWGDGASVTTTGSGALEESLTGGLSSKVTLKPGESKIFTWLVSWYFPNQLEGNGIGGRHYATRFTDAGDVAQSIVDDFDRLEKSTKLWHSTWNNSSLPQWFLDRTFQNTSVLATSTARRYKNGQFWAWEGVGSCSGTCIHVWQYAQAMGRIFPELERNLREVTDYGFALMDNGGVRMRGNFLDAAVDGQAGIILRTYREHQMSPNDEFLKPLWPKVKEAMDFLIAMDHGNGLLEGPQHNTLDSDWYGQVPWLSGLYIAALRAAEEMAMEMDDASYAADCRTRWQSGSQAMADDLFNGKYFYNVLDPDNLDSINSGTGCLIDQVMGQSWAFQVGLGRVLPEAETKIALKTLWDYNFTTDVGPFREKYTNARDYAVAGEPGLLMCTFPDPGWDINKAAGPNGNPIWVGYFNECQSGYEYEVASHMIAEGMVDEGLSVVKAIDSRYNPSKRNPYNEVEAGSHYARSMAVYGSFITACGFEYHGPQGYLAFAPKLNQDDFRAAFTAAEGWGTLEQKRGGKSQRNAIEVKYGMLSLESIAVEVPLGTSVHEVVVKLGDKTIDATFEQDGPRITFELNKRITMVAGERISIGMR